MGKYFILAGVIFIGIGILLSLLSQFSFWKVGKLPGDIYFRKGNFSVYFPLTTCLLLSLLLTLVLSFLSKK